MERRAIVRERRRRVGLQPLAVPIAIAVPFGAEGPAGRQRMKLECAVGPADEVRPSSQVVHPRAQERLCERHGNGSSVAHQVARSGRVRADDDCRLELIAIPSCPSGVSVRAGNTRVIRRTTREMERQHRAAVGNLGLLEADDRAGRWFD
jgi:hypothetical protein